MSPVKPYLFEMAVLGNMVGTLFDAIVAFDFNNVALRVTRYVSPVKPHLFQLAVLVSMFCTQFQLTINYLNSAHDI